MSFSITYKMTWIPQKLIQANICLWAKQEKTHVFWIVKPVKINILQHPFTSVIYCLLPLKIIYN